MPPNPYPDISPEVGQLLQTLFNRPTRAERMQGQAIDARLVETQGARLHEGNLARMRQFQASEEFSRRRAATQADRESEQAFAREMFGQEVEARRETDLQRQSSAMQLEALRSRLKASPVSPVSTPSRRPLRPQATLTARDGGEFEQIVGSPRGLMGRSEDEWRRIGVARPQSASLVDEMLSHVADPAKITPLRLTMETALDSGDEKSINAAIDDLTRAISEDTTRQLRVTQAAAEAARQHLISIREKVRVAILDPESAETQQLLGAAMAAVQISTEMWQEAFRSTQEVQRAQQDLEYEKPNVRRRVRKASEVPARHRAEAMANLPSGVDPESEDADRFILNYLKTMLGYDSLQIPATLRHVSEPRVPAPLKTPGRNVPDAPPRSPRRNIPLTAPMFTAIGSTRG